jgi:hypothetical protein
MSAVKAWSAWSIAIKDIDMDAQFDGTVNFIFQPAKRGCLTRWCRKRSGLKFNRKIGPNYES